MKILAMVMIVCVMIIATSLAWGFSSASATQFEPTPTERLIDDIQAYEAFAEGRELERMLSAFAHTEPCLSAEPVAEGVTFFWWCARFKLIDEVYTVQTR